METATGYWKASDFRHKSPRRHFIQITLIPPENERGYHALETNEQKESLFMGLHIAKSLYGLRWWWILQKQLQNVLQTIFFAPFLSEKFRKRCISLIPVCSIIVSIKTIYHLSVWQSRIFCSATSYKMISDDLSAWNARLVWKLNAKANVIRTWYMLNWAQYHSSFCRNRPFW